MMSLGCGIKPLNDSQCLSQWHQCFSWMDECQANYWKRHPSVITGSLDDGSTTMLIKRFAVVDCPDVSLQMHSEVYLCNNWIKTLFWYFLWLFPPDFWSSSCRFFFSSSSVDLWVLNLVIYSTEAKSKRNHALLAEMYPVVVEMFWWRSECRTIQTPDLHYHHLLTLLTWLQSWQCLWFWSGLHRRLLFFLLFLLQVHSSVFLTGWWNTVV